MAIDEANGIQWPFPDGQELPLEPERRLFEDGKFYHSDQKAVFMFEHSEPMPEPTSGEYPFVLLTGRGSASQWHTQTRTSKSAILRRLYPESIFAEINPEDARDLGLQSNDMVEINSVRGSIRAKAFVTHAVNSGTIFIPMHYAETNQLTASNFDPYSKQPSYKACAVSVTRSDN